ncbi:hypothetical protein ZOSMA_1406G00010, partial [Zostera marina]
APYTMH